jgi:hypothetical protein
VERNSEVPLPHTGFQFAVWQVLVCSVGVTLLLAVVLQMHFSPFVVFPASPAAVSPVVVSPFLMLHEQASLAVRVGGSYPVTADRGTADP